MNALELIGPVNKINAGGEHHMNTELILVGGNHCFFLLYVHYLHTYIYKHINILLYYLIFILFSLCIWFLYDTLTTIDAIVFIIISMLLLWLNQTSLYTHCCNLI